MQHSINPSICCQAQYRIFRYFSFYISFHFISFHFISFHFISFHFISFHFISFYFILFYFILYYIISVYSSTVTSINSLVQLGIYFSCPIESLPSSLNELVTKAGQALEISRFPPSMQKQTNHQKESRNANILFIELVRLTYVRNGPPSSLPLPPTLTYLSLNYYFTISDTISFPNSLLYLQLGSYSRPIPSYPPLLKTLILGDHFNEPLPPLPSTLTSLHLSNPFNQSMDTCLPRSLLFLCTGSDFNQPISSLPPKLLRLTLGSSFTQLVDNLPKSLTHLSFGSDFNQPIEFLPPNLTHLCLGERFDRPVDYLPPSLLSLTFGEHFNNPIPHYPPKLTHLTFGNRFNQSLTNLPSSLTHLAVSEDFCKAPLHQPIVYPPSLSSLTLWRCHCIEFPLPPLTCDRIYSILSCCAPLTMT